MYLRTTICMINIPQHKSTITQKMIYCLCNYTYMISKTYNNTYIYAHLIIYRNILILNILHWYPSKIPSPLHWAPSVKGRGRIATRAVFGSAIHAWRRRMYVSACVCVYIYIFIGYGCMIYIYIYLFIYIYNTKIEDIK